MNNRKTGKELDLEDFIDVLELRSDLLRAEPSFLILAFNNEELFPELVKIVDNFLYVDDCSFALLDDQITNLLFTLINTKRFEIKKTNPETYKLINKIISKLNENRSLPKEAIDNIRINYLINQARLRNMTLSSLDKVMDSMGVDIIIYDYLRGEEIPEDVTPDLIIGSIIYLNRTIPTLFASEEAKDKIATLLDNLTYHDTVTQTRIDNFMEKVLKR